MLAQSPLQFFVLVLLASLVAGFGGSLIGLGGAILMTPILTIFFGVPIRLAIGASVVSIIATSSGAAAAYVRDHITNLRVGMSMEVATTLGAIGGALLAAVTPPAALYVIFGLALAVSALPLIRKFSEELPQGVVNDRWAERLRLASSYPDQRLKRIVPYRVTRVPLGFAIMGVAGLLSGLLGIGSGVFKVLAMDTAMRLPLKVSTTTSNFMIGVTAAASAGIYFQRGDIDPLIATPVALGVLAGATLGARVLPRLSNTALRAIFLPVVALIALQMLYTGVSQFLGH
jgi:uncharacterized membrane protein YfcA